MEAKTFADKKIKIRKLSLSDLQKVKQFQGFINSLVKEDAQIKVNKKQTEKEERDWLKKNIKRAAQKRAIILVAEDKKIIVGNAGVNLGKGRHSHVGTAWVAVREGYRGIGLGSYLLKGIIALAKEELTPELKILQLIVYPTNKRAIKLYERLGFKRAAEIPKQTQYKGKLISSIVMLLDLT